MSTQTTTEHFYSPPKAGLEHDGIVAAGVSAGMLAQLDGTSGWVRLIGVLSLLAALATAFGAVAMLFIGTLSGDIPGGDPSAALEAGVVGPIVAFYVLMALAYGWIGVLLFRFASAIRRAVASRDANDVLAAVNLQRRFWRLVAILFLIGVIGGLVMLAVMTSLGFNWLSFGQQGLVQ